MTYDCECNKGHFSDSEKKFNSNCKLLAYQVAVKMFLFTVMLVYNIYQPELLINTNSYLNTCCIV